MNEDRLVLVDVRDGVAQLTLNRPVHGNALNIQLAEQLYDALSQVATDDSARAVLFSGNGPMLCGGGDLNEMSAAQNRRGYVQALVFAAHKAVRAMARLEKPIVTLVQGSAAGAGLSLVLLSDIVIAAKTAKFVTAYTRVGLTPDCGQSWLLPRAIGTSRAIGMTLESPAVSADDAQTLGIVSRVAEADLAKTEAHACAQRLADGPAAAFGHARALVRAGYTAGFDAHLDREAELIAAMAGTEESGRMIASFVARSSPAPRSPSRP